MRVILFIIGHPVALKAVNTIRGGIFLGQDNEVLCFSENIQRKKDEALLAVVSGETMNAWETTLQHADQAQRLIDEIGMTHDPYYHHLRLSEKYITILDKNTYRWMYIKRGGWGVINKSAEAANEPPVHDKDIELFFTQHAETNDELSRVIIRATQLHTKSRTSNDHFTAFVLMYIALDAILTGDTLNTAEGDEIFKLRALTLVHPEEHQELLSRIKIWKNARNDLIHRAGGERISFKDDSIYQPLTEQLRLLLSASIKHLSKKKISGLTTLKEAWGHSCQTPNYISLKSCDRIMAIESSTTQASEILARSKSHIIESIIASSLNIPST
jgi:hypothetical protein